MFSRLFANAGLSLDRLRALVEVGACGSIVKASGGDPVKQSQFSRQIKELEDFFQIRLIERQGKGIRLTASGKELARISRFFLLGLSNFQRGSIAEEQTFRVGGSATAIEEFLLPVLAGRQSSESAARYAVEVVSDDAVERRLHDLTLDFGVTTATAISRPLQMKEIGAWRLKLWVPRDLFEAGAQAIQAFQQKKLPLVLPVQEFPTLNHEMLRGYEARVICETFSQARTILEKRRVATFLPDFLEPRGGATEFLALRIPPIAALVFQFRLAWNPRLLRLNPHAGRQRDWLAAALSAQIRAN
jgi:DNA-binding transcriptional LysR family regulator